MDQNLIENNGRFAFDSFDAKSALGFAIGHVIQEKCGPYHPEKYVIIKYRPIPGHQHVVRRGTMYLVESPVLLTDQKQNKVIKCL